jgi:glc operon protein GlcG
MTKNGTVYIAAILAAAGPAARGLSSKPDATPRSDHTTRPMKTKPLLELSDLKRAATAAEALALERGWAVTIAIADDGGHLLWLQRLDGAAPVSASIAASKARTAALGRRDTKVYEDMINQGRTSFLSAPLIDGLLEGGVPIVVDGQALGAVGVSGVKSVEDAEVARAAVAAIVG